MLCPYSPDFLHSMRRCSVVKYELFNLVLADTSCFLGDILCKIRGTCMAFG